MLKEVSNIQANVIIQRRNLGNTTGSKKPRGTNIRMLATICVIIFPDPIVHVLWRQLKGMTFTILTGG